VLIHNKVYTALNTSNL